MTPKYAKKTGTEVMGTIGPNPTPGKEKGGKGKMVGLSLVVLGLVGIVGVVISAGLNDEEKRGPLSGILMGLIVIVFIDLIVTFLLIEELTMHSQKREGEGIGRKCRSLLMHFRKDLWARAKASNWWRWAEYTARMQTTAPCLVCAEAWPLYLVIPNPYDYITCRQFYSYIDGMRNESYDSHGRATGVHPYATDGGWNKYGEGILYPIICLDSLGSGRGGYDHRRCKIWNFKLSNHDLRVNLRRTQLIDVEYECYTVLNGRVDVGKFSGRCKITWICEGGCHGEENKC